MDFTSRKKIGVVGGRKDPISEQNPHPSLKFLCVPFLIHQPSIYLYLCLFCCLHLTLYGGIRNIIYSRFLK